MKPQTFLRLSLLLPYVLWVILFLLTQIQGDGAGSATNFLNLELLTSVYLAGILYWFVPYTLLALGLLVWTINRPVNTIIRAFALSPLLLVILMLLEINIISIVTGGLDTYLSGQGFENFMALNALAAVFSLVTGYLCVGTGFALYKLFQSLKIIKEIETEPQPMIAEAV